MVAPADFERIKKLRTQRSPSGNVLLLSEITRQLKEKLGASEPPKDWVPWRDRARPNQLPPDDQEWFIWLLLAGRGFGKTRTGVEWLHERMMQGDKRRWAAIIGRTPAEVRDIILQGPGGLLTNAPPHQMPEYIASKRRVVWPTGAYATIYSGANPEQLRGFSGDTFLSDEIAAWDYPQETWDMLMFGMREAKVSDPQGVVATTPKPIKVIKDLLKEDRKKKRGGYVHVTTGSSYDNKANLSERYYKTVIAPYEGTRLGRQEIYAEVLEDVQGALWTMATIDRTRWEIDKHGPVPPQELLAIAIDPAVTANKGSDETGIIAAGAGYCKCRGKGKELHGFVFEDGSGIYSPRGWAGRAFDMLDDHSADLIVGEVNNGGDLVEVNLSTVREVFPFEKIVASRGKKLRAQPVANYHEQGKIHLVGFFPELEDQMTTWVPHLTTKSPDRVDAAVYALTKVLSLGGPAGGLNWGN